MSMKASLCILKKGTTAAGTAIGAMRTIGLTLNGEMVDVTNADSTGKWRELLAGAGNISASISMAGVLKDTAAHAALITDFIAKTIDAYGVTVDTLGTFDGSWQLTSLEMTGEHNGELQYSLTLESSGAITFAAIS
jgi:TP901-1 family phage major tail protein